MKNFLPGQTPLVLDVGVMKIVAQRLGSGGVYELSTIPGQFVLEEATNGSTSLQGLTAVSIATSPSLLPQMRDQKV